MSAAFGSLLRTAPSSSLKFVRSMSSTPTRQFFVGGNWKCNGTPDAIEPFLTGLGAALAAKPTTAQVVLAPPMVLLDRFQQAAKAPVQVSAQDCWFKGAGAYTGETSAELIKSVGVQWTLVGHSERRARGEPSSEEGAKAAYALQNDIKVIACIGEQLSEREGGQTMQVLAEQMQAYVDHVSGELGSDPAVWAERFVIAYEPVWAIGTGVVASPEQAQDTQMELRAWLAQAVSPEVAAAVRIIYGGSVSAKVCDSLADKPDVDGFLVGGASLKADEFSRICQAAARKAL